MKLNLKKRLLIYISSVAIGAIVILLLVIIPGVLQLINLHKSVSFVQTDLNNNYERTKKMKRSLQEINQIKEKMSEFSKAILNPNQELEIITNLEKIAEQNHIEQNLNINFIDDKKNISPSATHPALSNYYQFSFLNNGSFLNHLKYLQALEKTPYYIVIQELNFEKRRNDPATSTPITLRFNAIIYVE